MLKNAPQRPPESAGRFSRCIEGRQLGPSGYEKRWFSNGKTLLFCFDPTLEPGAPQSRPKNWFSLPGCRLPQPRRAHVSTRRTQSREVTSRETRPRLPTITAIIFSRTRQRRAAKRHANIKNRSKSTPRKPSGTQNEARNEPRGGPKVSQGVPQASPRGPKDPPRGPIFI